MAKWPNVPSVYGWLSLDKRGNWLIKGESISNPALNAFISRNYAHDERGCWYFQNGPQRVFVELAYTPFVYFASVQGTGFSLKTHNDLAATNLTGAWIDDGGILLLQTEHGVGLVRDLDLENLVPHFTDASGKMLDEDALETRLDALAQQNNAQQVKLRWNNTLIEVAAIRARDVAKHFGFNPQPAE